jgi:hypothetical protein
MNPIEDEPSFIGPRPEPTLAPAQVVGTPVTPVVSRQGVSNKTPLVTAPSDTTGDGPDNDNHAPPLTDQDPSDFTPAQEAFIRQLLDQQRGTLNTSWRNHLDQQAGHAEKEHQSIHLQHAKQISALTSVTTTAQPLYLAVPCASLSYPGPNKSADRYKQYLTLLEGELGLNPAMELFLNGKIDHPISSDDKLCNQVNDHFRLDLNQQDWDFEPKNTGYTISVVRRTKPELANLLLDGMNDSTGRQLGQSYMQLNKCLYMTIHRTCDPVKRDKNLLDSTESGKYENVWDGLHLYNTIHALSKGENGTDLCLRRTELVDSFRQVTYVPGVLGVKAMFDKVIDTRSELAGMDPPTVFDDATLLSYIHRELERKHELFTEAKEIIENNRDSTGNPTSHPHVGAACSRTF